MSFHTVTTFQTLIPTTENRNKSSLNSGADKDEECRQFAASTDVRKADGEGRHYSTALFVFHAAKGIGSRGRHFPGEAGKLMEQGQL
jgi:hypothetical protein